MLGYPEQLEFLDTVADDALTPSGGREEIVAVMARAARAADGPQRALDLGRRIARAPLEHDTFDFLRDPHVLDIEITARYLPPRCPPRSTDAAVSAPRR